jgi:hypothetical protein
MSLFALEVQPFLLSVVLPDCDPQFGFAAAQLEPSPNKQILKT